MKMTADQASTFLDLGSLNQLRSQSHSDQREALRQATREFEAFFVHEMLKNMRAANRVIGHDNLLNSNSMQFYEEMHDQQLSIELSKNGRFGIADLMFKQLVTSLPQEATEHSVEPSSVPQMPERQAFNSVEQPNKSSLVNPYETPDLDDSVKQHSDLKAKELVHQTIPSKLSSTSALPENKLVSEPGDAERYPLITDSAESVNTSLKTNESKSFSSKEDFIERITPYAKTAAKLLNTHPGVLIAQAALETGWGQSMIHSSTGDTGINLFGIKSSNGWQGESSSASTIEFEQGIPVKRVASFRVYDSIEASFADYVNFIKNSARYQAAQQPGQSPKEYIQAVHQGGYATDPDYANKVMTIFEREGLMSLDQ